MEDDVWLALSKAIRHCYQTGESLIVMKANKPCGVVFQREEALSLVVTVRYVEEGRRV